MERVRNGFIKAQDVCEIVKSKKIQCLFSWLGVHKPKISLSTAQKWLIKINWCYNETKNGMYIDRHERDDIVAY